MAPEDIYLESKVLTADPVELVCLLYRGSVDAVRDAQACLAGGRILERARALSKAHAILGHLSGTLDVERGGTLSRRLAELYDYMQRRLIEANRTQQGEPLREVERLLADLLDGWERIGTGEAAPAERAPLAGAAADESVGGYPYGFDAPPGVEYAAQSWSL